MRSLRRRFGKGRRSARLYGDSGYGEEGTTGEFPVHLHLGIYLKEGTEEISVNPYPVLRYAENARIKCVYSR